LDAHRPARLPAARQITRRDALRYALGAAAAGVALGARRATAFAPSDELRVASVGVGNMGWADLSSVASAPKVRIVALCDVNADNLGTAAKTFDKAKQYADYRKLFDELAGEIDAVTISTPDHMHGAVSLAAMDLGKHVYVQKPLAHNLAELRRMRDAAAKSGVVTQMGTQKHSSSEYRTAAKLLRDGAVGKVREVHSWVGKVWSGPAEGRPDKSYPVPPSLAWDLWLGVAPERPFVPEIYTPMTWRGWRDFGSGTLGDMACHLFDPVFTGLELAPPVAVVSRGEQHREETFAPDEDVEYTFAGTPHTADEVTLRWTDGAVSLDRVKPFLPAGTSLPDSGSCIVGDQGVMLLPHTGMPQFYRDGQPLERQFQPAPEGNHWHEWAAACRGEGKTSTPFSYSCPVTEAVLVGVVAGAFKDEPLKWNSEKLTFDKDDATALVRRTYRDGWEIAGL
jgi:predicted dehydrogenase